MARYAGYGMVLAYARLGRPEEAAAVASCVNLTREQRRVVNRTIISDLAVHRFDIIDLSVPGLTIFLRGIEAADLRGAGFIL